MDRDDLIRSQVMHNLQTAMGGAVVNAYGTESFQMNGVELVDGSTLRSTVIFSERDTDDELRKFAYVTAVYVTVRRSLA
jgi:hypothetical protein